VTLSPTSKQISADAQKVGFYVTPKTTGGSWTVTEDVSWLSVSTGGSGQGYGLVEATVSANTGSFRTGTISVGGVTFSVIQGKPILVNGSGSDITINSTSVSYELVANVDATTGEVWTARCISRVSNGGGATPTVSLNGGAYSASVTGSGSGVVRSYVSAGTTTSPLTYYDTTTVFEVGPVTITVIQDIP
jgi:hypothetical protein